MMEVECIYLDTTDHPAWDEVELLFGRMYEDMEQMGLMIPLAENGAGKWIKTVQNTSGKYGIVVLAKINDKAVGFAHGMIKFLPDYLGGYPVGSITHVFIDEAHRKRGIGRELVNELEEWFRMKKVDSIELQVVTGNPVAKDFWASLGYGQELIQFRKQAGRD